MNYNSQIHKQSVKKVERFFCLTSRGSGVRLPLLPLKDDFERNHLFSLYLPQNQNSPQFYLDFKHFFDFSYSLG